MLCWFKCDWRLEIVLALLYCFSRTNYFIVFLPYFIMKFEKKSIENNNFPSTSHQTLDSFVVIKVNSTHFAHHRWLHRQTIRLRKHALKLTLKRSLPLLQTGINCFIIISTPSLFDNAINSIQQQQQHTIVTWHIFEKPNWWLSCTSSTSSSVDRIYCFCLYLASSCPKRSSRVTARCYFLNCFWWFAESHISYSVSRRCRRRHRRSGVSAILNGMTVTDLLPKESIVFDALLSVIKSKTGGNVPDGSVIFFIRYKKTD